ncbi:GntR family transcriptional regulator [Caproiciproducens sp. LBM24188]|nr:GntR family transcriptional regulator [Oscillospiraceae bacterium]HHV31456.1 GntR family transcriptional regulator [Clostridiales bacterium]
MENIPVNSSEYIYRCLKEEILHLKLKPGQSISENELCKRFSVSRTPIRSVMQRLSGEGLMNIVPYKGSFVALLNFNDIEQIIYMRIAVESAVLRDFIPLCTPLLEEKLRYIIRKQMVLMEEKDLDMSRFYELDSQFHEVWFKTAGHNMLWELIQKSEVDYTRFRMLDIVAVQNLPAIIEEHKELFQLIHERRPEGVQPLIEKHLNGGIHRLQTRIHTELRDYFQPESGTDE